MATRFLSNDSLWSELHARALGAKPVRAAVAFLGKSGADLLPLKNGDALVVNLGMQAVKQGLTSPQEIQRLLRRGVKVFTRSTLHAKFFICDGALLVGSANVSNNSKKKLDEAAALTTDTSAIRRATDFFNKLCTEPVRPEYLKACLKAYKPPVFVSNDMPQKKRRHRRIIEAKVWFISGLRYREIPEREQTSLNRIDRKVTKRRRQPEGTYIDHTHYTTRPRHFAHVRVGDWVINCIADSDGQRFVHAPQQILGEDEYDRGGGKQRYILSTEASDSAQKMTLADFRKRVKAINPRLDTDRPRTMPVEDVESADDILRLWTATGRIAKHKKSATTRRRTAK